MQSSAWDLTQNTMETGGWFPLYKVTIFITKTYYAATRNLRPLLPSLLPSPPKSTLKQVKSTAGSTSEGWNIFWKNERGRVQKATLPWGWEIALYMSFEKSNWRLNRELKKSKFNFNTHLPVDFSAFNLEEQILLSGYNAKPLGYVVPRITLSSWLCRSSIERVNPRDGYVLDI